nr:PE-PGRS family protein PE_PGRS5-like [Aegilops tauschii subsp. strangulata]
MGPATEEGEEAAERDEDEGDGGADRLRRGAGRRRGRRWPAATDTGDAGEVRRGTGAARRSTAGGARGASGDGRAARARLGPRGPAAADGGGGQVSAPDSSVGEGGRVRRGRILSGGVRWKTLGLDCERNFGREANK